MVTTVRAISPPRNCLACLAYICVALLHRLTVRCLRLQHLDLTGLYGVGDAALRSLRTIPTLTSLTLAGCVELTDEGLKALVTPSADVAEVPTKAPHATLTALDISGCRQLGGEGTTHLISRELRGNLLNVMITHNTHTT